MRYGLLSFFYEDLSTDEEEVEKCNRYNIRRAMRKKYVPQQNPSSIEELKEITEERITQIIPKYKSRRSKSYT